MLFLALKKIRKVKSISRQPTTQQKISSIAKFSIALTWGNFRLLMNTNLVNLSIIMIKCFKKIHFWGKLHPNLPYAPKREIS